MLNTQKTAAAIVVKHGLKAARELAAALATEIEKRAIVTCDICGAEEFLNDAVKGNWYPTYYLDAGNTETGCPICGCCISEYCKQTDDGPELIVSRNEAVAAATA